MRCRQTHATTPGADATETQRRQHHHRRAAVSADPALAGEVYINREQLRSLVPASDMSLWRWQRNPAIAFPPPVKLGENGRNFWWLPAIRAWLRRRETTAPQVTPRPQSLVRQQGTEQQCAELGAIPTTTRRAGRQRPERPPDHRPTGQR
jgi:predicted DNA-binding transcriptional regulator AlpA